MSKYVEVSQPELAGYFEQAKDAVTFEGRFVLGTMDQGREIAEYEGVPVLRAAAHIIMCKGSHIAEMAPMSARALGIDPEHDVELKYMPEAYLPFLTHQELPFDDKNAYDFGKPGEHQNERVIVSLAGDASRVLFYELQRDTDWYISMVWGDTEANAEDQFGTQLNSGGLEVYPEMPDVFTLEAYSALRGLIATVPQIARLAESNEIFDPLIMYGGNHSFD